MNKFKILIISGLILNFGLTFSMEDELIRSSKKGDLQKVRNAIQAGVDVNATNSIGQTALSLALMEKHSEIARELIRAGANVNAIDTVFGLSALGLASSNGYLDIVRELIKKGANVNAKDLLDQTPLLIAVIHKHLEIVKELIRAGADINVKDSWKWTPLMHALYHGHLEIAKLLEKTGADTAIIKNKQPRLYKILTNWSALIKAVMNRDLKTIEKITPEMDSKALISLINENGDTLLHEVIRNSIEPKTPEQEEEFQKDKEIIKTLLTANGDLISIKNKIGLTPIELAASEGRCAVLKLFINIGVSIDKEIKKEIKRALQYYPHAPYSPPCPIL